MPRTISEQLDKYLADVHSIEVQALVQMKAAPDIAGDPRLAEHFRTHRQESEKHEQLMRECLEAHGAKPAALKDLLGKATGGAVVMFARSQPDTPGKLTAHAFSYENMEEAAYELLHRLGRRVGDAPTVHAADVIGGEERAMSERLAASFDVAVDASLRDVAPADVGEQVNKYLADAHAIESQAIQLLEKAEQISGDPQLQETYRAHLAETRDHERQVDERLRARGAKPGALEDAALRLGALNWGTFFAAQPDTPAKLAAFAYAFEHLEIASYELLARVAHRDGDGETVDLATRIGAEERQAAAQVAEHWDEALEASLRDVGVTAGVSA